jgi:hypothetical protein
MWDSEKSDLRFINLQTTVKTPSSPSKVSIPSTTCVYKSTPTGERKLSQGYFLLLYMSICLHIAKADLDPKVILIHRVNLYTTGMYTMLVQNCMDKTSTLRDELCCQTIP